MGAVKIYCLVYLCLHIKCYLCYYAFEFCFISKLKAFGVVSAPSALKLDVVCSWWIMSLKNSVLSIPLCYIKQVISAYSVNLHCDSELCSSSKEEERNPKKLKLGGLLIPVLPCLEYLNCKCFCSATWTLKFVLHFFSVASPATLGWRVTLL